MDSKRLRELAAMYKTAQADPLQGIPVPSMPPAVPQGPDRAAMKKRISATFRPPASTPEQKFKGHMAALQNMGQTKSNFKVPGAPTSALASSAKQRFGQHMGALKNLGSTKSSFKVPGAQASSAKQRFGQHMNTLKGLGSMKSSFKIPSVSGSSVASKVQPSYKAPKVPGAG